MTLTPTHRCDFMHIKRAINFGCFRPKQIFHLFRQWWRWIDMPESVGRIFWQRECCGSCAAGQGCTAFSEGHLVNSDKWECSFMVLFLPVALSSKIYHKQCHNRQLLWYVGFVATFPYIIGRGDTSYIYYLIIPNIFTWQYINFNFSFLQCHLYGTQPCSHLSTFWPNHDPVIIFSVGSVLAVFYLNHLFFIQ